MGDVAITAKQIVERYDQRIKGGKGSTEIKKNTSLRKIVDLCRWIMDLPGAQSELDNGAIRERLRTLTVPLTNFYGGIDGQGARNLPSYKAELNKQLFEFRNECAHLYNIINFQTKIPVQEISQRTTKLEATLHSQESTANELLSKKDEAIAELIEATKVRKESISEIDTKLAEFDTRIKNLGKTISIAERAQTFSSSAKRHEELKYVWIGLAAAMGLFMALYVLLGIEKPADTSGAVAFFVIQKLTLISVLSTLLILFARMFRVEAHNEIANRHRADALNTFDKFYNSGDNDETKRAVLIQAITAAFAPLDTGIAKSAPPTAPVYDLPKLFADMAKSMTKGS